MKRCLFASLFFVLTIAILSPSLAFAAPASGYKFISNERLSTWRGMRDSKHVLWQEAVSICDLTGTSQQRYGDRGVWCAVIAAVNNDANAAAKAIASLRGIIQSAGPNEIREDFIARVLQLDLVHPWLTSADMAVISPKLDTWASKAPNLRAGDSDAIVGEGCGAILWDTYNNKNTNRSNITNELAKYIGYAKGGQWIESSQYNAGTAQLLAMCNLAYETATGRDIVPGVSSWLYDAGTVAALSITPDFKQSIQWADDQYPRDFTGRIYKHVSYLAGLPNGYAHSAVNELFARSWRWTGYQLMEHGLLLYKTNVTPTPLPNSIIHIAEGVGQVFYKNGNTLMWATGRNKVPVDHIEFSTPNDVQVYQNGGWLLTHPIAYYGLMSGELIPNSPVYAGLNHFNDLQMLWTAKGTDWVAIANRTSGPYFTANYPAPAPFLRYGGRVTVLATVNGNPVVIVRDDVDMDDPRGSTQSYRQNSSYQHQDRINEFEGKFWSIWHMPSKPSISGNTLSWTAPNGTPVTLQNFSDQSVKFVTKDESTVFGSDVISSEKKWQTRINTDAPSLFQVFTVKGETVSRSGDTITVGNKSWTITKNGITPSSGTVITTTPPTVPTTPPPSSTTPTVPTSTKFTSGSSIVTTSVLNVRSSPSTSASIVGTQQTGAVGTITGASVYANGYHWWNVNYASGADGWSAEDFLKNYIPPVVSDVSIPPATGSADITLNPNTRYQTIQGWEATSQSGQDDAKFSSYKNQLFDLAANELGITRIRLEVRSGAENTADLYAEMRNGSISNTDWKARRYDPINDNNDPNVINPAGFHFSELDSQIDNIVLPLRTKMAARGEKLFVNLNYVSFGKSTLHSSAPAEYAEFMLAMFQHMKSKYGFVPDAIEVILEPDNTTPWRGNSIGQAIAVTGARLAAAGFRPDFIAPSTMSMANAAPWFDQIAQVPGALNYLKEISYHRYTGVSDANLQAIASRAKQYGLRTGMLEHIGSGHEDLHRDLKLGMSSAWQQFTLAFPTSDNGAQYYVVNSNGSLSMGSRTPYLAQYFRFVRPGAVRIDASTSKSGLDPLAFVNSSGGYSVVVKTTGASTFSVKGLPAGRYGITYSTASQKLVSLPDIAISANQNLSTSIPAAGVITIYSESGSGTLPPISLPPLPPPPVTLPPLVPTDPASTKFSAGDRVMTTSSLQIRTSPSTSAASVGTAQSGAKGTVVSGGIKENGYYWWNVNYDNTNQDGWSVENFLAKAVDGPITIPEETTGEDTTPPTVSVSSPAAGAEVSGSVQISVQASDPSGMDAVEIFVGSKRLIEDSKTPFGVTWNTKNYADGEHVILVKAYDKKFNVSTASIPVQVNNQSPIEEVGEEKKTEEREEEGNSSGADSTTIYFENGVVEFEVGENNRYTMIGLSNADSSTSDSKVDFGFYLTVWNTFRCQAYGASLSYCNGTFKPGDEFRVGRSGETITYSKNGQVLLEWQRPNWQKAFVLPLKLDTAPSVSSAAAALSGPLSARDYLIVLGGLFIAGIALILLGKNRV